MIYLTAIR